jgi:serine/threonine-protein kinase
LAGRVCNQDPKANTQIDPGSSVTYTVYAGPAPVQVPQVTGFSCQVATTTLTAAKLKAQCNPVNNTAQAGTVLAQDPVALASALPGSTVTLSVSNGKTKLPDVTHLTYDAARIKLQQAGWLKVSSTDAEVLTGYKVGQVMAMNPAQGSTVDQSTPIVLTVAVPKKLPACSTSATPTTSPSVSGRPSSSTSSSSAATTTTPSPTASPTCTPAG